MTENKTLNVIEGSYVELPGWTFFGFFCTYELTGAYVLEDCGWYPKRTQTVRNPFGAVVVTNFPSGRMILHPGFINDGASGPTYDRVENRVAGFFHDGGYRQIRAGNLRPWKKAQYAFDELYGTLCRQYGMYGWWASVNEWTVKKFGGSSAKPQREEQLVQHNR